MYIVVFLSPLNFYFSDHLAEKFLQRIRRNAKLLEQMGGKLRFECSKMKECEGKKMQMYFAQNRHFIEQILSYRQC